jgi:hypothetical protein
MSEPTFSPQDVECHFDACMERIGTYSRAAYELGLKTAWGVQKWRGEGVPPDKVIPFCALAGYVRTPHQLRHDIYPHPDDGLPADLRGLAA